MQVMEKLTRKLLLKSLFLPILMVTSLRGSLVQADTSISIRLGDDRHQEGDHRHEGDTDRRGYWAYDRDGNRRYYRRRRIVEGVPMVIAPVPQTMVTGLTGDYGTDLANLNGKLARLRAIVQRQKKNESFSQDQYDGFMNVLDGIEHDEHARAFDEGGNLDPETLSDLLHRVDQASEDIQIALAQ